MSKYRAQGSTGRAPGKTDEDDIGANSEHNAVMGEEGGGGADVSRTLRDQEIVL